MNYNETIEELVNLFNDKKYNELVEKLLEISDPILYYPFMALLSLADDKIEEAKNTIERIDLSDYLTEEYEYVLNFISTVSIKINVPSVVELICKYFYNKTENIKAMFSYYELQINNSSTYEECQDLIETIIINTKTYNNFSHKTQFFILHNFYENKDLDKLYELCLNTDEKFQVDTGIFLTHAEIAFKNNDYNFIVDYFEMLESNLDFDNFNDFQFLSLYIQSKDILFMEISFIELNTLSEYLRFFIDNYKIYSKYIGKYDFTEDTIELLNILDKKDIKINEISNEIIKYLIEYDFYNAIKLCNKNNFYPDTIVHFAYCLLSYDEEIKVKLLNYLVELYNNDEKNSHYYIYALEVSVDSKKLDDFEELLSKVKLEDEVVNFKYRLEKKANQIDQRHYLYYFGEGLLNVSKNPKVILYAKAFLLSWYYFLNEYDKFTSLFEEIEEDIDFSISNLMILNNPLNLNTFHYLLEKKDIRFALHYINCIDEFLYKKINSKPNLKLVGKIISILEELFLQFGDNITLSQNCLDVKKGIYKYYLGEMEESEKLIIKSAYNSSKYCNCGVFALLTLNDYKYGEKAYEINKKIVFNSINGLKLIDEDRYLQVEFNNNLGIYLYYAYYALNDEQDFEIQKAYRYIMNEVHESVQSCYYIIKLAQKLNIEHVVLAYEDKLRMYRVNDIKEYELKYTEIIENSNCTLYKPETFSKTLFLLTFQF